MLHKYTQAEYDAIPRDENEDKHCPTGDYTDVDFRGEDWVIFGNFCKLGNRCRLGNDCELGDCCELGEFFRLWDHTTYEGGRVKDGLHITCGAIGSENRTAYAYIDGDGAMYVRAGCWFGGLDALRERVRMVHAGTIYETQYLAMCDYAERVLPAMLADRNRRRAE